MRMSRSRWVCDRRVVKVDDSGVSRTCGSRQPPQRQGMRLWSLVGLCCGVLVGTGLVSYIMVGENQAPAFSVMALDGGQPTSDFGQALSSMRATEGAAALTDASSFLAGHHIQVAFDGHRLSPNILAHGMISITQAAVAHTASTGASSRSTGVQLAPLERLALTIARGREAIRGSQSYQLNRTAQFAAWMAEHLAGHTLTVVGVPGLSLSALPDDLPNGM